ncbi:GPI-linked NAD(P)(+)--arginine ADP-ribosyltransferase 1 [Hippoglossus stenolepis]|uniref:GPI-linked NAD(P)(+)--arginine ADP-ribosyltransferase 1 n=1 Tax=Hippoglossus stenolepis TaxID=195615 RepID=UPI00159C0B22|nr:GPI-linked NAD(P)(+)--arginine ADP-ribosyltransferase 1 [Hippoglossus stenolepis]XP_047200545.1 GPI-linked NAD(P)(+)--arginine ADP-ribosyltransferase 1 [Hippoglossus stenolepis]XP_047200546.1 GPI-linked NAD(P)(+)--arginine ADP-ribosyltransferase 1 [Hippoglossus stenolepis]
MWNRRKVLLAAVVFTALYYSVAAEEPKQLDMAPDAVDYLYDKCRNKAMDKFIHSGLLRQELNLTVGFRTAWNVSSQCSKLIPGGIKEHTAALGAYVNGDFKDTFNSQVETMGGNVSTYENNFSFKSLHFLLMDYMVLQKPQTCKNVYVLPDKAVTAQVGSKVRLRRFTLAELSFSTLEKTHDLDDEVILNITSCFFAEVGENICMKQTNTVLLSPAEEFTVESRNVTTDHNGEYTVIVLKASGQQGSNNCDIFSRSPAVVSTHVWLVLVLLSLSLSFFC